MAELKVASAYYRNIKVTRNAGTDNELIEIYCSESVSKNLLLDGFFARWSSGQLSASGWRMFVGSGNAAPIGSNTQLQSQIGSASDEAVIVQLPNENDAGDYYCSAVATCQWPIGSIVGTVREIGANIRSSTSGADLDSRALIVDGNGAPTEIIVGVDDQLSAEYVIKFKIPTVQDVSVKDFGGVSTTCTLETLNALNQSAWGVDTCIIGTNPFSLQNSARISSSQGIINNVEFSSSIGTLQSVGVVSSQSGSDRVAGYTAGGPQLNAVGNISYLVLIGSSGAIRQGVHFNPPVAKDSTKSMFINFGYSLAAI